MPPRHRSRPRPTLLERTAELAAARKALRSTVAGSGRLLFVEGPAGIGKTSLLRTLQDDAGRRGVLVRTARAGDLERDLSFGVVRQLFEALLVDAARRRSLMAGPAAKAAPAVDPSVPTAALPDASAVVHGLYWLAANLTGEGPVVFMVDDVHDADEASLRFLAYLARRLSELPVLVAVASRPDSEPWAQTRLLSALRGEAIVLRPKPLGPDAVAHLVRQRLPGKRDQPFIDACAKASGGNPFLLHALLGQLATDEVTQPGGQAEAIAAVAPAVVVRAVEEDIRRLPALASHAAAAVAVLDRHARADRVAAVTGLELATARASIEALIGAGILEWGPPPRFVHPIVRAAVLDRMSPVERSNIHAASARALAAAHLAPDEIAAHLLATEPAGDPWVVEVLVAAASLAIARGAPAAAAAHLARALREPAAETSLRGAILVQLGTAQTMAGDPSGADTLATAVSDAPDPAMQAQARLMLAQSLIARGRVTDAYRWANAGTNDIRPELRELGLQLDAVALTAAGMLPVTDEARTRAARHRATLRGDTPGERAVLAELAFRAALSCEPAESVGTLVDCAARQIHEDLRAAAVPFSFGVVALTCLLVDRWPQADAIIGAGLDQAVERGSETWFGFMAGFRGLLALMRGQIDATDADARQLLEVAEDGGLTLWRPLAAALCAEALIEQGRVRDAGEILERWPVPAELERSPSISVYSIAAGRVALLSGRPADAVACFERIGSILDECGALSPALCAWRSWAALAHHAIGDRRRASALAEAELELVQRVGAARPVGNALRVAGLVAGGSRGLDLLEQAVSALDSTEAQLDLARTLVAYGAALRRANRRLDARAPLARGMDLAHRLGAGSVAGEARDELRATGARPRTPALTGRSSLTTSEERAALLAADGLSNQQIAHRLFVTLKTVEKHLGNAYAKLGITSRSELSAALTPTDGRPQPASPPSTSPK